MTINQAFEIFRQAGGIRAARIITDNTKKLSWRRVYKIARQLRAGVPVAKIINQKWFFGLKFYTNKSTLDLGPATESLVAAVIADCEKGENIRILDLGTGTGCIISALAKNIYGASGVGIDKSWQAVRVANLVQSVKILRADFSKIPDKIGLFDVIVSNPPYIAFDDSRVNNAAMFDPMMALFAPDNGLGAYKVIAKSAKKHLKKNGKIYLEIGQGQTKSVKDIFVNNGWDFVRVESDLAGIERVLVFEKR